MLVAPSSLNFTANRRKAVLVTPARPTPHEVKLLSDVDDQPCFRFRAGSIYFYRRRGPPSSDDDHDPAEVIKKALAKALVFYYPLAGRIREGPNGKLAVECNAEGVPFVEADANVGLDQFGDELVPPIPGVEELAHDEYGASIVDSPPLSVQVTRLNCGGFILACYVCHAVVDATGLVQFLSAVTEMARGLDMPKVLPVWARDLLFARPHPRITHNHPEYEEEEKHNIVTSPTRTKVDGDTNWVQSSFFFGPKEMLILRMHLPHHSRSSSDFDVLTAWLWRSRSLVLSSDPNEKVYLQFPFNTRGKIMNPVLPAGYYGNAVALAQAQATVGQLHSSPFGYTVELVMKAKANIKDGHLQSVADLMVLRGRPSGMIDKTFRVTDVTKVGFDKLDFGWGEPVSAMSLGSRNLASASNAVCYYRRYADSKGEEGTLVSIHLPERAMHLFKEKIEKTMEELVMDDNVSSYRILSRL